MRKVAILGGGITGLTLGFRLKHQSEVILVEKSPRLGGYIQTTEKEGFLFEKGPRSFRPRKETLNLIEELGLTTQMIPGLNPKRYIYAENRLRLLESYFLSPSILWGLFKDLVMPGSFGEDESIFDFFSRRCNRHVVEKLIDPMVLGIYAGDIRRLSMKASFPQIAAKGSLIRGILSQQRGLYSFKNGMETLTKELSRQIEGETLLSTAATSLKFHEDHVTVGLSNGRILEVDHVYSTLPAKALATLWSHPVLEKMEAKTVTVVNFGYRKKVLAKEGFGYLVPSSQKELIYGVVFDSSAFPQQNKMREETRLTVMMPGGGSEEEAKDALARHLQINVVPDVTDITHAREAIPQYQIGHQAQLGLMTPPPRLTILGSSFHGVAVNDCIASVYTQVNSKIGIWGRSKPRGWTIESLPVL